MSIRKRMWVYNGRERSAWVADYFDAGRRRRHKTFKTKEEASRFLAELTVGRREPEPHSHEGHSLKFTAPIPTKKQLVREAVAGAFREAYPGAFPTADWVAVEIVVRMPPSHAAADVDNLLKPVLDALKGLAWMDDTQVAELLVRKVPSRDRRMSIQIWQSLPGTRLGLLFQSDLENRP